MTASPIIDVIRVNARTYAWSSCAFSCDGMPWEGVVGLDWEERLDTRVVYSNQQDGAPLGMAQGRYQIATFPLRMLRDTAARWKTYLTAQASTKGSGSFGQAVFELGLELAGRDAGDLVPTSTLFSSCRVLGEKLTHQEGIEPLVTEFTIGCLLIEQDNNTLWNALPAIVGGFPVADSITVAGLPAPGKWTLEKADKVYGWQVRQATAMTGATVVPIGDDLVEPEFNVEFWDPLDYQAFKLFRTAYLKKPLVAVTGSPTGLALGIDHPELKELGVGDVVVKSITPVLNDGYGVWSCKVKFLQYRKPLPALSKPSAAIPDNGVPRPTAKTQTQIALLQGQAELAALKAAP